MRAVVTGVAGFIGSQLAEELIKKGHFVVGIDCFTPYYSPKLKRENLVTLNAAGKFRFVKKDILNADLGELVTKADVIFHLAAQPGVRLSWSKFSLYVRNNLLATQAVLEACSKKRRNLVFASSSSIYGDSETYPTAEDAPVHPASPYGVTKEACERLCGLYGRGDDMNISILRYFTVFGPRQRPDMGIHRFIDLALRGLPLPVYGDGNQERDFTFVSDIVAGTMAAAENQAWGEVINLGGGRPSRLNDVIQMLLSETGSESEIRHYPQHHGDPRKTAADISKARRLLGFKPSVDLKTGIRKQVEWQKGRV